MVALGQPDDVFATARDASATILQPAILVEYTCGLCFTLLANALNSMQLGQLFSLCFISPF